jgi:hypothetical protein
MAAARVHALIDAARRHDVGDMHRLLDWSLPGAARMVAALADVDEADRARLVETGLAELAASRHDLELVGNGLRELALALAHRSRVRPADDAERDRALAAVRVPATPAGVGAGAAQAIDAYRREAAAVTEVFVVELERPSGRPEVFALTPDGQRLIRVRP